MKARRTLASNAGSSGAQAAGPVAEADAASGSSTMTASYDVPVPSDPAARATAPDELQVAPRPVTQSDAGTLESRIGRRLARAGSAVHRLFERDALVLAGLLALAATIRFPGLEARGRFDGDQGHDMLVLLRLVRDGILPLLGPPTSIGDFHHGAAYYYLLAPAAWLSDANPTAVVAWIAVLGVAAVAATWWFARSVGGRVTAAIAGLLLAVSPAAVEESTFIWNPNPVPLFAALALGCAWRAHATGAVRWWIPAVVAAGVVLQLHVLGIVFLPSVLGLATADAVRAWRGGRARRSTATARSIGGGLVLAGLLFVPLAVSEFQTGFEETRRVAEFLSGGNGAPATLDPVEAAAFAFFRIVGWPLVGLVTDAPVGALVAVSAASVLSGWLMLTGRGPDGTAARWLGWTVLWSAVALSLLAPSLQVVVAGLPNDHYHAFLDPVVIVLVALSARAITRGSEPHQRVDAAARSVVAGALAALVLLDIRLWPPADPNGGWPAAQGAGLEVVAGAGARPIDVRSLPIFKTAEGIGFPVIAVGGEADVATNPEEALRPARAGTELVVVCDRLFESIIGDPCGGPAEIRFVARLTGGPARSPVRWFSPSPRIAVTIFRP